MVCGGLGKGDIFGTGKGVEPVLGGKSRCVRVLLYVIGTGVVGRRRLEIFEGVALVDLKQTPGMSTSSTVRISERAK